MTGRIVGSIAGFYHVKVDQTTYLSKPRGIFRKKGLSPAVGDLVEVSVDDNEEGTITEVYERKNELVRPFVSNVDGAILVFSLSQPEPDLLLLDRLILNVRSKGIEPIILWSKKDLVSEVHIKELLDIYQGVAENYEISALDPDEVSAFFKGLDKGVYVLAGQSGVGKSTIFNVLSDVEQKTGDISKKLKRGRHTTRNSVLLEVSPGRYLVDTPGFQNLQLEEDIQCRDIQHYYPEFIDLTCKYYNCIHRSEPHCGVKAQVGEAVDPGRYERYLSLYSECEERRSY